MHDEKHEIVLQAMLVGDLEPEAPAARAQLQSCAECSSTWVEMQRVTRGLDELAHPQAQVLAEAMRLREAPGGAGADQALRRAIAQSQPRAAEGKARSRRWTLFVAAAVVLVVGIARLWWPADRDTHPVDPQLGNQFDLTPSDKCPALFPIRWSYTLTRGQQATLTIQTRKGSADEWRQIYDGPFRGPGLIWNPTAEEQRACGDRIRYRVTLDNAENEHLSSGWREAWL